MSDEWNELVFRPVSLPVNGVTGPLLAAALNG